MTQPEDWPDSNPLKINALVSQRDEFAERTRRAKQALHDALDAFERKDMVALEEILRSNNTFLRRPVTAEQDAPTRNDGPAVWELVLADMAARDQEGRRRYGTPLQPHNGRKPLVDAYQEALDLVVYLRQEIYEREGQ